jgi:cytochrome c oxidase assembly protein subunit 11
MQDGNSGERGIRRKRLTALSLAGFAVIMLGMSFAAVPLYRMFCQVTGYGGTTQRAEAPEGPVLARSVTLRLDANVAAGLPWEFKPETRALVLQLGETALVRYRAKNASDGRTRGSATFNVTPEAAGRYFSKIECFCFSEQILEAGGEAALPVRFFVDAAMATDPELAHVREITLSYTFFPMSGQADVVERSGAKKPTGS